MSDVPANTFDLYDEAPSRTHQNPPRQVGGPVLPGAGLHTRQPSFAINTAAAMLELTKPRLSALVLFTTFVGFAAGMHAPISVWLLLHTLVGTALIAGGANALNQIIERGLDAKMERTRRRPLPSGRLTVSEALPFAVSVSVVGLLELLSGVNLLTASLGALALLSYVFVYTPLKRVTMSNTLVGAVVGAIPPMMGWTAATGDIASGAWALFAILFVWQLPHFFSIAWLYRTDYLRGGFRMISVPDGTGRLTAIQVLLLSLILVPVSLMPTVLGLTGRLYSAAALTLGIAFAAACLWLHPTQKTICARRSFRASIIYLPLLLILLLIDKL